VFVGVAIFTAAFLYILPQATDLIDDHFMHVAWGRQLLYGRQPLLDMEPLGLPLQALLSAGSERLVGYRLLSEGLIIGSAFAGAAVLTFVVARAASDSLLIGVLAATFQVALGPRTYSYPKILVYAAAILLLWRYIDCPTVRRAITLGAAIAVAFYFRHDHGLYTAVPILAVLALRHGPDWRMCARRVALVSGTALMLLAPFLVYVQRNLGLVSYLQNLRSIAVREYQQNHFDSLPSWPFVDVADVVEWDDGQRTSAAIGVRWNAGASERARREAAARYGLRIDQDEPVESGQFLLTNLSHANVLALQNDSTIEDTSGINRGTGDVPLQGLWFGRVHLLGGLDAPYASAGLLFFVFVTLLLGTPIALLNTSRWPRAPHEHERIKIASVVLLGVITSIGFIREPLAVRIPDAIVAPVILGAWWGGRWWMSVRSDRIAWRRFASVSAMTMLTVLVIRAAVVQGAVPTQLEAIARLTDAWQKLMTTPPVDAWQRGGTPKYSAVRYVRACTAPHEPLLVLWFAPDVYYYSDRPFAGRLGFYIEGYWATDRAEQMNIDGLERDRPAIALMETDREATDLYTYPRLLRYLDTSYHHIGTVPSSEGRTIEVLARNDRHPSSTDDESGWPCYR
jgi:hypothetical protein